MEETKEIVRHVDRQVRFVKWLCVLLFVLLVGSQIQLQLRNRDIAKMRDAVTHTQQAATEARVAARKASKDLTAAITASTAPQDPKGPVPTALREIHEIKLLVQKLDQGG